MDINGFSSETFIWKSHCKNFPNREAILTLGNTKTIRPM